MSASGPGADPRDPQGFQGSRAADAGVIEELAVPDTPTPKPVSLAWNRVLVVLAAVALLGGVIIVMTAQPGDGPIHAAQATPTSHASPTARPSPAPSPPPGLAVGVRHEMSQRRNQGVWRPISFAVPSEGWGFEQVGVRKGSTDDETWVRLWGGSEVNLRGRRCANPPAEGQGPADWSLADFVRGIRTNPDIRTVEVGNATVDGYPAKVVGFTVRPRACDERGVWSSTYAGRMMKVWLVDFDGEVNVFTVVYPIGPDEAVIHEADQIIDSIQFGGFPA